eukprot:snap_masked-scaffold_35-processed-gene-1.31-mRNA-1 protein AED:1.00 eAED:1.00 QI:0/0/0/0/1/1/2/0/72
MNLFLGYSRLELVYVCSIIRNKNNLLIGRHYIYPTLRITGFRCTFSLKHPSSLELFTRYGSYSGKNRHSYEY